MLEHWSLQLTVRKAKYLCVFTVYEVNCLRSLQAKHVSLEWEKGNMRLLHVYSLCASEHAFYSFPLFTIPLHLTQSSSLHQFLWDLHYQESVSQFAIKPYTRATIKWTYQVINAEGTASLRKLRTSCNASTDRPVQVSLQAWENLT